MIVLAPRSDYELTYEEALLYCKFLEYDDYKNWRMPTYQEWLDLDEMHGWFYGRLTLLALSLYVIPVRTINLE